MADELNRPDLRVGLTMTADGNLVIPAELRVALGMENGGKLIAHVEDGSLVFETIPFVVARVQAMIRRCVPDGTGMVDEFIPERRAEAERE